MHMELSYSRVFLIPSSSLGMHARCTSTKNEMHSDHDHTMLMQAVHVHRRPLASRDVVVRDAVLSAAGARDTASLEAIFRFAQIRRESYIKGDNDVSCLVRVDPNWELTIRRTLFVSQEYCIRKVTNDDGKIAEPEYEFAVSNSYSRPDSSSVPSPPKLVDIPPAPFDLFTRYDQDMSTVHVSNTLESRSESFLMAHRKSSEDVRAKDGNYDSQLVHEHVPDRPVTVTGKKQEEQYFISEKVLADEYSGIKECSACFKSDTVTGTADKPGNKLVVNKTKLFCRDNANHSRCPAETIAGVVLSAPAKVEGKLHSVVGTNLHTSSPHSLSPAPREPGIQDNEDKDVPNTSISTTQGTSAIPVMARNRELSQERNNQSRARNWGMLARIEDATHLLSKPSKSFNRSAVYSSSSQKLTANDLNAPSFVGMECASPQIESEIVAASGGPVQSESSHLKGDAVVDETDTTNHVTSTQNVRRIETGSGGNWQEKAGRKGADPSTAVSEGELSRKCPSCEQMHNGKFGNGKFCGLSCSKTAGAKARWGSGTGGRQPGNSNHGTSKRGGGVIRGGRRGGSGGTRGSTAKRRRTNVTVSNEDNAPCNSEPGDKKRSALAEAANAAAVAAFMTPGVPGNNGPSGMYGVGRKVQPGDIMDESDDSDDEDWVPGGFQHLSKLGSCTARNECSGSGKVKIGVAICLPPKKKPRQDMYSSCFIVDGKQTTTPLNQSSKGDVLGECFHNVRRSVQTIYPVGGSTEVEGYLLDSKRARCESIERGLVGDTLLYYWQVDGKWTHGRVTEYKVVEDMHRVEDTDGSGCARWICLRSVALRFREDRLEHVSPIHPSSSPTSRNHSAPEGRETRPFRRALVSK